MAMPVTAQMKNRGMSFFNIFPFNGRNKNNIQNKPVVTNTLIRFRPNGKISVGDINLTILKLTPNKKLAVRMAICAFAFGDEVIKIVAKVDDPKTQTQKGKAKSKS